MSKREYTAHDIADAAASGWRDGVRHAVESGAVVVPEGVTIDPKLRALLERTVEKLRTVWPESAEADEIHAMLAAAPAQGQQMECQECMLKQPEIDLLWSDRRKDADLIHQLRTELSALKAQQVGQEPVAWRVTGAGGLTVTPEYPKWAEGDSRLLIESLYTAPQPAPAQDVAAVRKMARALSDRQADACNVDREDQWKLYSEDFVADVEAMLAAAHDKQSGG